MRLKDFWKLLKGAGTEFFDDQGPRFGAALAFYTIFALAPLLVIVIAIVGFFFGEEAARGEIVGQLRDLVGTEGGEAIQTMIYNASKRESGLVASTIGIVVFLVAATGLFVELQESLNTVWEVQPKPGRGILGMLRDRLLSFGMMLGMAFLLLVSLIISAALSVVGSYLDQYYVAIVGQLVNIFLSLLVITLVFAMIFKFLPDAVINWRDVWLGAFVTACLFVAGKTLIGLYLGHSTIGSTYGAAGSLAVLALWLYYSSQIFLFGAELTQQYALHFGTPIRPAKNALPLQGDGPARETV